MNHERSTIPESGESSQEDDVTLTLQRLCDLNTDWSFTISLGSSICDNNCSNIDECNVVSVPAHLCQAFQEDGFVVFPNVLSRSNVDILNEHLEDVLRGHYDRGRAPDKTPTICTTGTRLTQPACQAKQTSITLPSDETPKEPSSTITTAAETPDASTTITTSPPKQRKLNAKVLQIINVHKADSAFRQLACSEILGQVVAQLAGWSSSSSSSLPVDTNSNEKDVVVVGGTRLAQDQVWAKPPGAPPLTFHRDSPYFMFEPNDVVTVWVALDDMHESVGPLEYVRGSHLWGDGRVGSANQFFQPDYRTLLRSAAAKEGICELNIVSMAGLSRGGISIHNGRTWHGSGRNHSTRQPRRGLGLHFVPAHVKFTSQAAKSRIWKSYVLGAEDPTLVELSTDDFPITWTASRPS